jgi:hypothetical protein
MHPRDPDAKVRMRRDLRDTWRDNGDMNAQTAQQLLIPAEWQTSRVSRKAIYRDRGALPALHAGRLLRIDPTDFRRLAGRRNRMRFARVAPKGNGPVASVAVPYLEVRRA